MAIFIFFLLCYALKFGETYQSYRGTSGFIH